MDEMYKRSIQMIKKLKKIPSHKEWNSIAKEKCLMSHTTLQFVEKQGFHNLCASIRRAP